MGPPILLQVAFPSDPLLAFLAVIVLSALPPILFVTYLRNAERHRREPWRVVAKAFAWGATAAVLLAGVVQLLFSDFVTAFDAYAYGFSMTTVVLAPFTEEIAKVLGLRFVRDPHPEPEDGFVYGGALGLGFAATENVLYVSVALLTEGSDLAIATAVFRVVTVCLHGATTAIAGFGLWQWRHGGGAAPAIKAILAAMVIHAAYNALVTLTLTVAILLAAGGAVWAFLRIRRRVRALDRADAAFPPP